ncbi:MAG TPA: hypothetical protein VJ227_04300 [Patescibacteria group bacterium]|nr:hypothetical protein [Patescibacteria group bacterium]
MGYIVVYEGTGRKYSNTKGMRTIIQYEDEAGFQAQYAEAGSEDLIIAKGISEEKAEELVRQTSTETFLLTAIESAVDENGHIHPGVLALKLKTAAFMLRDMGREVDISRILLGKERK